MAEAPYVLGPPVQVGKRNKIVISDLAEPALQNHIYDANINPETGKRFGYRTITKDFEEFPKMLYHPDWGLKPKPDIRDYSKGAQTPEAIESAQHAFSGAMKKWERGNRVKTVTEKDGKKELDRLGKIGWLTAPPKRESTDKAYDEDAL